MQKLINGRRVCDRYVLLERIGAGGHGEIWRVYDEQEARELALKILHPAIAGSPEAWTVLQHEFLMVKRLSHPGILRTDAPVRDGDIAALPMEFAGAGDLRRLRGSSYLRVVPVLVRIAEVLEHAHERGVVHRDLKPGNVLFDTHGRVRLADFGAAGLAGSNNVLAAGSPFSASPQQLRNERAAPADDIYGLGALAYELLSGYPPFYPDFDLQRVLSKMPPLLAPIHPAPLRLVELVTSMLAKEPRQRPSMDVVIERLNATLADTLGSREGEIKTLLLPVNGNLGEIAGAGLTAELEVLDLANAPPTETFEMPKATIPRESARHGYEPPPAQEAIIPPAPPPPVLPVYDDAPRISYGALPPHPSRRDAHRRSRLMWLAGLAAAVGGIVALPFVARWLYTFRSERPAVAAVPVAAPELTKLVADPAQGLASARDDYNRVLAALETQQAALWAGKSFAAAKAAGDAAERSVDAGDFAAATQGYFAATQLLQGVAAGATAALERELASGGAALADGRSSVARQAFERARRIDTGSQDAQRGIRDAEALDNALARMADAARAEEAGDMIRALAQYNHAARLAPNFPAAIAARNRLQASVGDDQHARAVARGLQAFQNGKLDAARAEFERAQQSRPSSTAASDGLARVQVVLNSQDVDARRRTAADLEERERWRDAAEEYQRALDMDSTLAFARAGHDRSIARAELGARLDALISQPERLGSNAVYADALNALERARDVTPQGPVLRSQVSRLQILLEDFNRPVAVSLQSDNSTSISIARVGALGSFTRRELMLRPGRYTVIGIREGFHDVRHEITLNPGQRGTVLSVQCTDPI
ncbi:MAG: protein kinase [Steroidobacteraceae bacterium]